jgi:hypothetical protein
VTSAERLRDDERPFDDVDDELAGLTADGEFDGDTFVPETVDDDGPARPGTEPDADEDRTSTLAVFEGDEGSLELAQRRALVVLIKKRFISARTDAKEWAALIANPRPIRARLNDLFLELVLDVEREVAYKRQVAPEGGGRPFPTLLYDKPWGREETLALVHLRTRHRNEQAAGADRAMVDRSDIVEFIAQHRPESATDRAGDARKALTAVENVFKTGLLIGPSTGERFEISNAIEVLLPLEKLKELLTWMHAQNESGSSDDTPTRLLTSTGTDAAEDTAGDAEDIDGLAPSHEETR